MFPTEQSKKQKKGGEEIYSRESKQQYLAALEPWILIGSKNQRNQYNH